MNVERNRAAVLRVYEWGFNQGRLDVVDECIAPGAGHEHALAADEPDLATHVRNVILMLRAAMPDLYVTIEDSVAEGDRVVVRFRTTGTHSGSPLFGVRARGKAVDAAGFHALQFDDQGRAVRDWVMPGVDEIVRQISAA